MAELKIRDLPFIKLEKSNTKSNTTSFPDVSLQQDLPITTQEPTPPKVRDFPFIGSKFKLFGSEQTTLEKAGEEVKADLLSLKDKMVKIEEPLKKGEPEIFGVNLENLSKGYEKVKYQPAIKIADTIIQDIKNLYGDVGVPEEAKIAGSKEEKEFFGFNTDSISTTPIPFITDKTGREFIDFAKLKSDSTSILDFTSKIGKHITKTLLGDVYALGDLAMKTTFLPIQIPISAVGQTLEEVGMAIGKENLQNIETKLFGTQSLKPDEIKEAFEELAHIQLANMISSAPKPSYKSYFKDTAKNIKVDPKNIVIDNLKPETDKIIDNTLEVVAEEVSKQTGRSKDEIKQELSDIIVEKEKSINNKVNEELNKNKKDETVEVTVGTAEEIAGARQELKDLKVRHEQEKIETFGEDWLTKDPKEFTLNQKSIYEDFYARQSKELNEVVQKIKALEKKKKVSNNQTKDFEIPKEVKEEKGIPQYVDNAIQMAANFNYKARWNPGPKHLNAELGVEIAGKDAPKNLLTRDELLANFVKDFDIGIGVTKSRKALGQFFPSFETLRLRYKNDIDTAAHELGHFLDKRIDKISDKYMNDPVMNRELKDISYDVDVVQEGFGEFVRRYLVNPKNVQEAAPKFFEWFDKTLKEDGFTTKIRNKEVSLKKALLNAQSNFSQYFKQSPLDRIDSKIGYNITTNSKRMTKAQDYISNFLDGIIGIENMEKNLGKITPDLYMRASNLRQGQSVLKLAVEIGVPEAFRSEKGKLDIRVKKGSKPLNKILEPIADDYNNFIRYIVSKSAFELRAQNRERLFNDVEIAAGLKLETPLFEKTFKEYIEWNKGIVEFAIEYGDILTKDQVKKWNRIWYLPFWRANKGTPGSKVKGQPTAFKGIKSLTGGSENLRPILENMIGNADMLIGESIKNRIKLEMLEFAREYKAMGSGRFIMPVPVAKSIAKDKAIVKDIKNQLYENLFDIFPEVQNIEGFKDFKNFLDWSFDELGSVMSVLTVGKKPRGYEMLMPVVSKGKTYYFEVTDPLLFRAIQSLDKTTPLLKGVFQLLGGSKKLVQNSITLSFDFMAGNIVRDQLLASIMSQSGYKPYYDGIKGILSRLKKDPDYIEWMANGGDLAGYYINEGVFKKQLKKFYDKKGINLNTVITSPKQILNALEALASLTEIASRLGEYKRARREGVSISEAVYRSKNISVDFSKRGAYEGFAGKTVQFFTETVPFLRAGMLGTERVYRGFAKDPNRKQIAIRAGMLGATSMVLASLNSFHPFYQSLEDWDKDAHWHFILPRLDDLDRFFEFVVKNGRVPAASYEEASGYNPQTGETNPYWTHLRMPKIWEIGAAVSVLERAIIDVLGSAKSSSDVVDYFNAISKPFHMSTTSFFGAAFEPIVETFIANKDSFTGRPIEYEYEKDFIPELKGEGRVSKTSTKISEAIGKLPEPLNWSPPQIEQLMRGYFGTMADYGLLISDQFFFNDSEDLPLSKYPLIRRFTKPIPNRNSKYVNEAYAAMSEMTKMVSTIREYNKRLNPSKAYSWLQAYAKDKNMTDEEFLEFISKQDNYKNKMNKKLIEYNQVIGLVDNSPDLKTLLKVANIVQSKYGKIKYIDTIYKKKLNEDIGALKKFMKDDLYMMRNKLAETYVNYIEQLKGEE